MRDESNDQWENGLDQTTMQYLVDLAKVLRDRCSSQTRSSTPRHFHSPSPATITPPSTPLILPLTELETCPLPLDIHADVRRNEVDLSDEEIRSLWKCALPSDDAVTFDFFA